MNRKLSVGVSLALIFIAVTITYTVTVIYAMHRFDEKMLNIKEREAMYEKLNEIDGIVRSNLYFRLDEEQLNDAIAKGYLEGIGDKDSLYLSPSQLQRRAEIAKGYEATIGFDLEENITGYFTVTNLVRFSSAYEQGLMEGDVIVEINGNDILEIGPEEAMSLLSGAAGTKLEIVYTRDGEEITIEVTREQIETTVVYSDRSIPDIGYMRIATFNDNTQKQFMSVLSDLMNKNPVKGLIIDVRDTNGGYDLEMVATMLDRLLPTGVIVSGIFAENTSKILYTSDEVCVEVPIVVLVNENTYGFAELFAGVIGDSPNCATVGVTTYGKGTLQQLTKMSDGYALEMTVAVFTLPISGVYDLEGVKPTYEIVYKWYDNSNTDIDTTEDTQLVKAIEVIGTMMK